MSSLFATPCSKTQSINNNDQKDHRYEQTSVSNFDTEYSNNLMDSNHLDTNFKSQAKPFNPYNLFKSTSLQLDKENCKVFRKAQSLNPYDMNDLVTLLHKVQINQDLEPTISEFMETENQECDIQRMIKPNIRKTKIHKTCRYVSLRKQERQVTQNDKFQMLFEDQPNQTPSKGQDYVDQTQLSMKDVYRMHVLGGQQDNHQSILQYESQENIIKQYSNQKVLQNNGILQTYNSLITHKSKPNLNQMRKFNKIPFKVLDAPSLQDDFYLNLIDWSSQNVLAVALASCVYLWSAHNNKVFKFFDFGNDDMVCSVAWSPNGTQLSIGTQQGEIHLFDSDKIKKLSTLQGHSARVGSLAWGNNALASGSKDKTILIHDIRMQSKITKLDGHKQEVCGLKWSPDEFSLASGGNDNKLFVWRLGCDRPLAKFSEHQAAVKAIAWSPHRHGLLASGGGTADRTIRFFNTLTTQQIDWIDTGSQVCNLLFSKNINEFVSTHGYSMNQIICWKYPTLEKVTTLTGHTSRVLFLAMSPDGETIVTGAGDETLRFWNMFPKKEQEDYIQTSPLIPACINLR